MQILNYKNGQHLDEISRYCIHMLHQIQKQIGPGYFWSKAIYLKLKLSFHGKENMSVMIVIYTR